MDNYALGGPFFLRHTVCANLKAQLKCFDGANGVEKMYRHRDMWQVRSISTRVCVPHFGAKNGHEIPLFWVSMTHMTSATRNLCDLLATVTTIG